MTRLMLDTSAYAALKKGSPDAIAPVRAAPQILVPLIVLGELLSGFAFGSRPTQNRAELDAFLGSSRVTVVPLVSTSAEHYAHIYAHLRRIGRPIPTNDLWIAASAMEHGATLLTADAHFLQVPQILVHHIHP